MTYLTTYSFSGANIAVDRAAISVADQMELDRLAASGSKADLEDFVTILSRYPATACKFLPATPLKPEGPLGMLNEDVLNKLDIDITGIIQMAMLLCLQVEREMRQMGLELSQSQVEQMSAKAIQERDTSYAANKAQLATAIAGAIAGIVTGAAGGAAGIASFAKMGQGEKLAASAKRDKEELHRDRDNLAKIREKSETTFDKELEAIDIRKTNLESRVNDAKRTKDEVTELRDKVLSDKNDQRQCAADEAAKARLTRKEEELDAAKREEQETAKELKHLDASGDATAPAGVDAEVYRSTLQAQHLRQKDEVDDLQAERDTLLGTTATTNPAAAAPFLQRDRDAVRSDIASKLGEKTTLEKTLADIGGQKARLVLEREALNKRADRGETIKQSDYDRLQTKKSELDAQETRARQELNAKDAELVSLNNKETRIQGELDGLIPQATKDERNALVNGVRLRETRVEALKGKKADLEREIESNDREIIAARQEIAAGGPGAQAATARLPQLEEKKATLDSELRATNTDFKTESKALQTERDELASNDFHKLDAAETRLKEQTAETEASKYALKQDETALSTAQLKDKAVLDAEAKRIADGLQKVEDKENAAKSKTEEAAAWRTGLDAIGKVLAGFTNLGQAALELQANNLRTLVTFLAKEFEIMQIAQGLLSSFADNMKSSLDETRQTFSGILDAEAKVIQTIAQRV